MASYLFVGERRSALAIKRRVTWKDGKLAGKQLFDALRPLGIVPEAQRFINVFFSTGRVNPRAVAFIRGVTEATDITVVGMGQKVQSVLTRFGIPHVGIVHPAARGLIRRKEAYAAHVRDSLLAPA